MMISYSITIHTHCMVETGMKKAKNEAKKGSRKEKNVKNRQK